MSPFDKSEGTAVGHLSTAEEGRPRRDVLAAVVRFQSLIGLALVLAGGIAFSPVRRGTLLFLAPTMWRTSSARLARPVLSRSA